MPAHDVFERQYTLPLCAHRKHAFELYLSRSLGRCLYNRLCRREPDIIVFNATTMALPTGVIPGVEDEVRGGTHRPMS